MSWDFSQFRDDVGIAAGEFRGESSSSRVDELWERVAIDRPDIVESAVRGYVDSGADLIIAFTDRLNRIALAGVSDVAPDDLDGLIQWNERIVSQLRELTSVMEPRPKLFCGIGPVEALWMLEEVSEKELAAAYSEQVRRCIDAGADGFLCRSFSELEPLRIAVRAVRQACDLPLIGSMTFDAGPNAMDTATGDSIPEACRVLHEAGADMVGVDRGEYPDGTAAIVSLMVQSSTLPVYAEVNAGRAEVIEQRVVYREPATAYGERLERLRDAGVKIVGGGLGTTREHIAQLSRHRERLVRKGRRKSAGD
ncbi:MAG: homocysteine S-methyltransferase family protein [Phycisphaerales bacterium]|nr:homocysteine S-methyltransferase family protein [Phycisphaerales bacterium]MCB9862275.1 homocysteine S-methyltransferase family protein [Phycisphaerales bacterium]